MFVASHGVQGQAVFSGVELQILNPYIRSSLMGLGVAHGLLPLELRTDPYCGFFSSSKSSTT
jgi:hypothetical protein